MTNFHVLPNGELIDLEYVREVRFFQKEIGIVTGKGIKPHLQLHAADGRDGACSVRMVYFKTNKAAILFRDEMVRIVTQPVLE